MKRDSSKIILIAGVLLFAIGSVLLPETGYVIGWYTGCADAASGPVAPGSCFINRWPGITAGGPDGISTVLAETALLSIFVLAGLGLALFGAYRLGTPPQS